MAVKQRKKSRPEGRLELTRTGKGAPEKNSRKEVKPPPRARAPRNIAVPWHRVGRFFCSAAILGGLLIFIAAVGYSFTYCYKYITTAAYFSLKTLEIQGNCRLSSKEILETAGLRNGGNVLALSLEKVEGAVARSPWVKDVSVKRVLPGKLLIGIHEKDPAFWMLHAGVLHYADAWGKIIAPVKPGKLASLPTLEVEAGAEEATAALPDLVKSLQAFELPNMGAVSWVRLSAARGVEVYMEGSQLKLTIGLEDWQPNLSRLGKTLADLGRRGELVGIREIKAQGANVWVEKKPEQTQSPQG